MKLEKDSSFIGIPLESDEGSSGRGIVLSILVSLAGSGFCLLCGWEVPSGVWSSLHFPMPWGSSDHLGFISWLWVLRILFPLGVWSYHFPVLVCWFILSFCWRVLMAYFLTRHYGPLLASTLLAGSLLGRLKGILKFMWILIGLGPIFVLLPVEA